MVEQVLETTLARIKENPLSGQSLLLFALCKTLDMPKSGHMYMLKKLQEMEPATRELAYGLMELMAQGKNVGDEWDTVMTSMEQQIKGT